MSEHEIIKNIIGKYSYVEDDVYVDKDNNMYKIDGFKLDYTFNFMDFYDIGWKAVTAVMSDIFSKGGVPKFILSSLGIDKKYVSQIEDIVRGIKDASDYYGSQYIGGDLNSASTTGWIDIAGVGKAICYKDVKNIQENDIVIISNFIGYTSIVFLSYINNWKIKLTETEINKVRHPIINRRIKDLFENYCSSINYSTDISDGLIVSLYNIIERSKKGIELLDLPFSKNVIEKTYEYGIKIDDLLKYGGEEFETLIVVKHDNASEIIDYMEYLGFSPNIIGRVTSRAVLEYKKSIIKKTGWDNFTGWF
ncbi:thiamine-phosphate kinase [Sulfurisphaera tokodaii]|uniref:Thiamine-monophosphate kinase n=2 Tax=Sulfurisphaera tokodaii TaxID=111955 RepID=F9VMS8_SULTO|nr:thiamine-phosphate kinase [Sulfurisphaera tokodaii]BAK54224.1 putative thiamine-monophosphate kinase [Sulfurisphaera tokodaii str. 7]HII75042.1 thiamine-monophosphate kinase [Sulfurisphaera tokodaii]